ncbi:MAG: hypothetical protein HKM93_01165 [Desulfobacteraceae bacterium]|nr:hypothetical protein [Desulfobacteraceae bacterium]
MSDTYIPFGPDWQKEMIKFEQTQLIDLLSDQHIKNYLKKTSTTKSGDQQCRNNTPAKNA